MSTKIPTIIHENWHNSLEFLSGMIDKPAIIELTRSIYDIYLLHKEYNTLIHKKRQEINSEDSLFIRMYRGMDEFEFLRVDELELAFDIAAKSAHPLTKFDFLYAEIDSLISDEYFYLFEELDDDSKQFIFRNSRAEQKKRLMRKMLGSGSDEWYDTYNNLSDHFYPEFKLNIEENMILLECLSEEKHCDYLHEELNPDELVKHLKADKETIDLWLDYLYSNRPNKIYAAHVLISMGADEKVIEPLKMTHANIELMYPDFEIVDELLLEEAIEETLEKVQKNPKT